MVIRMKKAMRAVLLCMVILLLFASCTPYDMQRTATEGPVTCCTGNIFGSDALVLQLDWDGDPDHTVIRIPETCGGQKITKIGGFTGTGVPTPATLTVNGQYEQTRNEPAERICLTIEFGRNIEKIYRLLSTGTVSVIRNGETVYLDPGFYMVAYEENDTYYTEGGYVYQKEDGSLVTGISYWKSPEE